MIDYTINANHFSRSRIQVSSLPSASKHMIGSLTGGVSNTDGIFGHQPKQTNPPRCACAQPELRLRSLDGVHGGSSVRTIGNTIVDAVVAIGLLPDTIGVWHFIVVI